MLQAALAVCRAWIGPVADGLDAVERSLAAIRAEPALDAAFLGFSGTGIALMARARLLGLAGQMAPARHSADEAVRIHRERSEFEFLCWSLSSYDHLCDTPAEFEAALAAARESLAIAEDTDNPTNRVISRRALCASLLGLGRFPEATGSLVDGLAEARTRLTALFEEGPLLVHLALAHLGAGQRSEAAASADEAVDVARRQGACVIECHALLTRARVGVATGAPAGQVAADVAAGLALVAQTGAVVYEAPLRALA